MMDSYLSQETNLILKKIRSIWLSTESSMRPWGVWICNYKNAKYFNSKYEFNSQINKVWFLDRGHIKSKQKSKYLRFHLSQIVRPWCSSSTLDNPIFSDRDKIIGRVSFAKTEYHSRYYMEWQFAKLYGGGIFFDIDQQYEIVNLQPQLRLVK